MTSTCGTHACGCGSASASDSASDQAEVARINGVALHAAGAQPPGDMLRQRACTELLRQQAQRQGLLAQDDEPGLDGATSAAAAQAIERLLEQALQVPEPSEAACRRYHAAHPGFGSQGERAHLRHVLFAVTPGVDVSLLRQRAERLLLELRDRAADLGAGPVSGGAAAVGFDPLSEAIIALQQLGYKPAEADRMARAAAVQGDSAEAIIRKALQQALR